MKNIIKLLKYKDLFNEEHFEFFQAIIDLEVNNVIFQEEREEIFNEIDESDKEMLDMSPRAQKEISILLKQVNDKKISDVSMIKFKEGHDVGYGDAMVEIASKLKDTMDFEEISRLTGSKIKSL